MKYILAMVILLASSAAHADELAVPVQNSACTAAVNNLERFLDAAPRTCAADADCEGHFFRAHPQARAVVLSKSAVTPAFEKELMEYQGAARQACKDEWGQNPASPIPFVAACVENACVDKMTLPQ